MQTAAPSQTTTENLVVEELYAGTLDNAAWDRAILGIADLVRASGAYLLAFCPTSGALLRYENHRLDPQLMVDYQRHWTYEDIRREYFLDYPTCVPVTEQMLPMDNRWHSTAILNEFLTPADVPHFMPAWLRNSPEKAVALSFQGTRKRGPFEAQDLEIYRRILPHVSRALEIRDRLERAQINGATLPAALEAIRFGVIVLDSTGKLLESNNMAQAILRATGQGIRRKSDGTLWLREPAGTQLRGWISTGIPPRQSIDGLLHVSRENAPPLSILVTPLPKVQASWITPDPRWLLLIFNPDMRALADAPLIAKDLGISAREAELSALLLAGENLQAIARRFGVSQHTVRTQLKSIYNKTGIRSQSELVRRIALGPAVHATTASIAPGRAARG